MPLTESQKSIITASIPFLESNGVEFTANFYSYMLETYPEVRPFFNKSHQITKKQPKILAFALLKYAENINDLTPLLGFVRQIVEKHVGLQVTPEQYDIVGTCLLKILKEMLGDDATDEFLKAWEIAYFDLANILIDLEKERYANELKIENAWLGFKDAKVVKIVDESDSIKSVYIKANDDNLAKFHPGQYITIRLSTDGGETVQSREYSLSNEFTDLNSSNKSGDEGLKYYRISIRRISGGIVSNFIHDCLEIGDDLQISAPYGKLLEPFLQSKDPKEIGKDVVFFIGGIGITPSISSIEFFLQKGNKVQLYLSNTSVGSRPFGAWLNRLLMNYPELLKVDEFISNVESNGLPNGTTNINYKLHPYRLSSENLSHFTSGNVNDYNYYLIGPVEYMNMITKTLGDVGFDITKINSEQYGPVAV